MNGVPEGWLLVDRRAPAEGTIVLLPPGVIRRCEWEAGCDNPAIAAVMPYVASSLPAPACHKHLAPIHQRLWKQPPYVKLRKVPLE